MRFKFLHVHFFQSIALFSQFRNRSATVHEASSWPFKPLRSNLIVFYSFASDASFVVFPTKIEQGLKTRTNKNVSWPKKRSIVLENDFSEIFFRFGSLCRSRLQSLQYTASAHRILRQPTDQRDAVTKQIHSLVNFIKKSVPYCYFRVKVSHD
jgi:hypothetical protein